MKRLLCQIILACSLLTSTLAQWKWQHPLPQGNRLTDIWPIDSNNVIAIGDNGTIVRTSNGGIVWDYEFGLARVHSSLRSLQFPDSLNGWCLAETTVLRTRDGGKSWTTLLVSGARQYHALFFLDSQHGWMSADTLLFYTTDGGDQWLPIPSTHGVFPRNLMFVDRYTGFATSRGSVYKSADGGYTWSLILIDSALASYTALFFADSLHGWAGGPAWQFGAAFVHTTDGGRSWSDQYLPDAWFTIRSIFFADTLHGWVVSDGNAMFTSDGGSTWDTPAQAVSGSEVQSVRSTKDGRSVWVAGDQGFTGNLTQDQKHWRMRTNLLATFLYDIKFVNPKVGWAVGDRILKTTTGGQSWFVQPSPGPTFCTSVFALDSLTAWCAAYGQPYSMLFTSNGGDTWIAQNLSTTRPLYSVFFINRNVGWAAGVAGTVRRTTNGGANWDSVFSGTLWDIGRIFFLDSLNGWMVGNAGSVWKSTNSGMSWIQIPAPTYPYQLWDVQFITPQIGWIAGESSVYKTTNGGGSWIQLLPDDGRTIYWRLRFIDALHGWTGANTGLYATTNGGSTWEQAYTPISWVRSVDFVDPWNGWIIDYGSGILHMSTGPGTDVEILDQPTAVALLQNYPNPFNAQTNISYSLSQPADVTLRVYDLLGREIKTLVGEKQPAGEHRTTFIAGDLSSGIYFCRLTAAGHVQMLKLLLLR